MNGNFHKSGQLRDDARPSSNTDARQKEEKPNELGKRRRDDDPKTEDRKNDRHSDRDVDRRRSSLSGRESKRPHTSSR